MSKTEYTLLGYRKFHSDKTNTDWCTAYFKGQPTTREEKNGFFGEKAQETMLSREDNEELFEYLQPWMVNKRFNVFLTFDKEIGFMQCLDKEPPQQPDAGKKA